MRSRSSLWSCCLALFAAWSESTPAVAQEPVGRLGADLIRERMTSLPTEETRNLAGRMVDALDRCDEEAFRKLYGEGSQISLKDTGEQWPDFESSYESAKTLPPFEGQGVNPLTMNVPKNPKPSQALYLSAGEMIYWLANCRNLKVDKYIFSLVVAAEKTPGEPRNLEDAFRAPSSAKLALTEAAEAAAAGDDEGYQAVIDQARAMSAQATARSEEVREDKEYLSDGFKNDALVWKTLADDLEKSREEAKSKGTWGKTPERQGGFLPGAKPGLAPGQEYAAAVPGAVAPATIGSGVEFAFTPGGSFASIGTEQRTNFNGTTHGKDIDYAAANLHGDLRYYWGGLAEGRTGWFRPSLIVGLKGAGTLGGADRGLEEDNHPPVGIESFVDYEIDGTLTPFFGLTLADFDCSRVNFLVGPRITFAEITGITDESGGGGVRERFSRNVVQVGPAFGMELDVPIRPLSREGFEVGVRVAGWGEYLPGTHVTGESSTFPFDYRFETEGAWVGTVRGGVFLRWGL